MSGRVIGGGGGGGGGAGLSLARMGSNRPSTAAANGSSRPNSRPSSRPVSRRGSNAFLNEDHHSGIDDDDSVSLWRDLCLTFSCVVSSFSRSLAATS